MYCQIDLWNKITFQVEKEEDLNVTAFSALNLYSSLMQSVFPLLLFSCGTGGAVWKLLCPNVRDKGHCWFVEVDRTLDDLSIHCDYLLEALETDEFNVCCLFKIIFDGLNPNIMNLVDTCYRLFQSITSL